MNDFAGAVAVLSLNARDYPQSSTSAFALGRAYRSAGHTERAKAEFNRALALDPKNKRASDALAAIAH